MASSPKPTTKSQNQRAVNSCPLFRPLTNPATLFNFSLVLVTLALFVFRGLLYESNHPRDPRINDNMSWFQKQFTLPARARGSYLITDTVVGQLPELRNYKMGLLNLFVMHTSCALSLNENVCRTPCLGRTGGDVKDCKLMERHSGTRMSGMT